MDLGLADVLAGLGVVSVIASGVVGWYTRLVSDNTKTVADRVDRARERADEALKVATELRVEMFREFVPHARFDDALRQINSKLDRVIERMGDQSRGSYGGTD